MKEFVRSALLTLGYRVQGIRQTPRQLLDAKNLRGVDFHDLVCRRMFEMGESLSFLQVGAFDGVMADPLARYIRRCRWRGVLVEPQPTAAASLRSAYRDMPDISVVEAAVGRELGQRTLFVIDLPNGPAWSRGLASFDRDVILKHKQLLPDIERHIRDMTIATTTFDALLRQLPEGPLDLLQIDTEGADADLLSLFPFDRTRPALVQWEIKHMTLSQREQVLERLHRYGYRFAPTGDEDMVAVGC